MICLFHTVLCLGQAKGTDINMKIEILVDHKIEETCINISCNKLTPELEKLIAMMRIMEKQFVASVEGETFILDVASILYIEAVDRKTFVYTEKGVYESELRLYELEEQLEEYGFFRASKSCLIQLQAIRSLRRDINRRIRVTMENGEIIMVSRQYAEELKRKLGIIR